MFPENDETFPPETETEETYRRPLWWRIMFVLITLLLIAAILAMTILPGLLASTRRETQQDRPTPTWLPRA